MKTGPAIPWKHDSERSKRPPWPPDAPALELEDTARVLFRELGKSPALSAAAWARIRSNVRARERAPWHRIAFARFGARLTLAALLAMAVPVTAAIAWRGVREVARQWTASSPVPSESTLFNKRLVRHAATTPAAPAPPDAVPSPPSPAALPAPLPAAEAPAPLSALPSRPASTARASEGQQLFEESELVGAALRAMRAHRPSEALGDLSLYRSRYPQGLMVGEAALTEVQADLELGLDAAALHRLEELGHDDFRGVPRPDEARLLRAELLARSDSCGRALVDFDALLAGPLESALEQRALWGRSACRSVLGDPAGERADLFRYLAKFPDGQFAGDARQLIAGSKLRR